MGKRRKAEPSRPARDAGATIAAGALVLALVGTALLVDTRAAASFDAPKRLAALLATAIAAAAAFAFPAPRRAPQEASWTEPLAKRLALLLAAVALLGLGLAALLSPRRAVALDAMRALLLFSLIVPLGASRVLDRSGGHLLAAFLAATGVNAAVAILQSHGRFQPFLLETFGRRQDTGAFAGNVGYLAITLSLAAVAALALLLQARRTVLRVAAAGGLALFLAGLAVTLNITAATAFLAGAAALLFLRFRARAILPLLAAVAAAGIAVAAYGPLRFRASEIAHAVRTGDWDALVSYRGGPWAASLEMVRERPLLGLGPGTFGAEYTPHRLEAEVRWKRRFVVPLLTSSYAEAHCEYLQAFTDGGAVAGLAGLGAVVALFVSLWPRAARERNREAVLLFAILVVGAVAALTWFPLQRPVTAVPLLLAAGRAWRIASPAGPKETAA